MKYTVEGLQQQALLNLECDAVDAIILRFVIDFFNSGAMKILMFEEEGEDVPYFWVHYDTIVKEIPIIGIKKQALRDRLDKYEKKGLMVKKVVKDKTGSWSYFRFVKQTYDTLIRATDPPCVLHYTPRVYPTTHPVCTPLHTIDSSISNSSTKEILILFEAWNAKPGLYKHKPESVIKNIRKKHEEIVKEIGVEQAIKAVDNYACILDSKDHFFNYKWTFWDFIARGIHKFVDEADPFRCLSSKKTVVDKDKEEFLKKLR